jgi:hypothetical protein
MPGYADSAPEAGLADLASFLSDTPEREPDEEALNAESPPHEDTDEDATTQQDEDEDTDEEPSEDEDAPPAPERKIKVAIKSDDGEEQELEVSEEELVKGYHRQQDYTKKTQALAERENQAVEFLKAKHDEFRQQYLSQAELARAAVTSMAGIKTEAELAELANSDPAAWVAESQRQKEIFNYLNYLDQQINGERQRASQEQTERQAQTLQEQYQKAWTVLSKEKIDKPALAKIYTDAKKVYGFTDEELGGVYDARLVMALRDAAAYQELKSKRAEVTKKAVDAPRVPNKQATTANERRQQKLNDRFKGGRAKLSDLAELLR